MKIGGFQTALVIGALVATALTDPALAQFRPGGGGGGPDTSDNWIMTRDGRASVLGCYRADRDLFGPNTFTFCLARPGSFTTRGRANCDGNLTWTTRGRDVSIDLERTRCRRGVVWERANVTCNATGRIDRGGGPPRVTALSCTYFPRRAGLRNTTFTGVRTRS